MTNLQFDDLITSSSAGGASAMTMVTELMPAGGAHAAIAPARFVDGNESTFAYETRYVDGQAVTAVLVDSKQSQGNRCKSALMRDIHDDHPVVSQMPRMTVRYGDEQFTDLDLPHGAFDGHIRAGSIDGQPVTSNPSYRKTRDSSPANALALAEMSPIGLVYGVWDSTRKTRQARFPSAIVSEIIGVLSEQDDDRRKIGRRGGARVDPVGMSVQLTGAEMNEVMLAQQDELSPKLVEKISRDAKAKKDKPISGSVLGLGGVPPQLDQLGVVSCRRIIRTQVLSFATLRQIRFGAGKDGDAAIRALLAALALAGTARADSELYLRANCHLVEAAEPTVTLDARYGNSRQLSPITIEMADELLSQALDHARTIAGLTWDGQNFEVVGNPIVYGGAIDEVEE